MGKVMTESEKAEHRELMRAMERQATLYALRHIRDDTRATPAEKLKAIELLMELEK